MVLSRLWFFVRQPSIFWHILLLLILFAQVLHGVNSIRPAWWDTSVKILTRRISMLVEGLRMLGISSFFVGTYLLVEWPVGWISAFVNWRFGWLLSENLIRLNCILARWNSTLHRSTWWKVILGFLGVWSVNRGDSGVDPLSTHICTQALFISGSLLLVEIKCWHFI
jgi:hypothetical protein